MEDLIAQVISSLERYLKSKDLVLDDKSKKSLVKTIYSIVSTSQANKFCEKMY